MVSTSPVQMGSTELIAVQVPSMNAFFKYPVNNIAPTPIVSLIPLFPPLSNGCCLLPRLIYFNNNAS